MNFNKELKTIEIYKYWFSKFMLFENKNEFIKMCKERYSIPTQKIIISAIKYFLNNTFSNNLKFPKNCDQQKQTTITANEYNKLMNNLIYENKYVSIRNKKIIETLWYTGIRANELLNLKWIHYENKIIKIFGKGNKKRYIPAPDFLFKNFVRKSEYIFAKNNGEKLTYSVLVKLFSQVKKILNRKDVSSHSMRHSFATRLLKKDIPIIYISKLLGHSNISITEKYIHWNIEEIQEILSYKDWLN